MDHDCEKKCSHCTKRTRHRHQIITEYETECVSGNCSPANDGLRTTNITTNIGINNVINPFDGLNGSGIIIFRDNRTDGVPVGCCRESRPLFINIGSKIERELPLKYDLIDKGHFNKVHKFISDLQRPVVVLVFPVLLPVVILLILLTPVLLESYPVLLDSYPVLLDSYHHTHRSL